jgi:hypothetical protein
LATKFKISAARVTAALEIADKSQGLNAAISTLTRVARITFLDPGQLDVVL